MVYNSWIAHTCVVSQPARPRDPLTGFIFGVSSKNAGVSLFIICRRYYNGNAFFFSPIVVIVIVVVHCRHRRRQVFKKIVKHSRLYKNTVKPQLKFKKNAHSNLTNIFSSIIYSFFFTCKIPSISFSVRTRDAKKTKHNY